MFTHFQSHPSSDWDMAVFLLDFSKKMMIGKEFFEIFNHLAPAQVKAFRTYLARLYPGQAQLLSLLNYLHAKRRPEDLTEEAVHQAVVQRPLTEEGRKNFSNLYSSLYKKLREYLLWEEAKNPSFEQDVLWLRITAQLKADKAYFSHLKQCRRNAESAPPKESQQYFKALFFNHLIYYDGRTDKFDPNLDSLERCIGYLDNLHKSLSMKYQCEQLNSEKMIKKPETKRMARKTPMPLPTPSALYRLYQAAHGLIDAGQPEDYQKAKAFFVEHCRQFSAEDQAVVLTYLLNYIARHSHQHGAALMQDAFVLYKLSDEEGFLAKENVIDDNLFYNAVASSLIVMEFSWARYFIEKYTPLLHDSVRFTVSLICQANVAFEQKQFTDVIALLEDKIFPQKLDNIRAKVILLKSYMESKSDKALSFCDSFEAYLRRIRNVGNTAAMVLNFLKLARKIEKQSVSRAALQKEFDETPMLVSREWLEEQISKYEQIKTAAPQ
ncbi:MAG: hypothetical protein KDD27_19840 [Saprospiraceae bacterium]|nr:hypothetical protein [Saprospiraceae bacterium]